MRLAFLVERPTGAEVTVGHIVARAVELLAAWTLVSVIVGLIVGRMIALGESPLAERLDEVKADRLIDEAQELYIG